MSMPFVPSLSVRLGQDVGAAWLQRLTDWESQGKVAKLLGRDSSLWTGSDENQWLGWLDSAEREHKRIDDLLSFQQQIHGAEFRYLVLLGMGGSSLGPEVQANVVGSSAGYPRLIVLDSTDPVQQRSVLDRIDPDATLVMVASKSGGTLETRLLLESFWEYFGEPGVLSKDRGQHFVAITDPGSELHDFATQGGFRSVFLGDPQIGGRFSVLSPFGLVPAAAIGFDLERWFSGIAAMAEACKSLVVAENPGVALGLLLAAAASHGQNKLMIVGSESVPSFGAWLEQLVAESTGKLGKMVLPVDGEPLREPSTYRQTRMFVAVGPQPNGQADLARFDRHGHSVASIMMESPYDLGGEFYRWMIATAVLGAELGVHPFDQPDVEAAKIVTRELTDALELALEGSASGLEEGEKGIDHGVDLDLGVELCAVKSYRLFRPPRSEVASRVEGDSGPDRSAAEPGCHEVLKSHLDSQSPDGYVAILAYMSANEENTEVLERLRVQIAEGTGVPTSIGFGPRYLHSTGQAHKGGPEGGTFFVITDQPAVDLPIPSRALTFGQVRDAQAVGDARVLAERGRSVIHVQLQGDTRKALAALNADVKRALAST